MKAKDYQRLAALLLGSLVGGLGILTYGAIERSFPPKVDLIWTGVDQIRSELESGGLVLKEGEMHERFFHQYQIHLQRLMKDASSIERYQMQIRPTYDLLPTTIWRPSSWDMGLTAYGTGPERRAQLVAVKKIKD